MQRTIIKNQLPSIAAANRYAAACVRSARRRNEDPRTTYTPIPNGDGTFRVERAAR